MGEDSGRGSVKFEEGFPPIHSSLPLPALINDRFLINLLTGWDYLSALNKRISRASILISPENPSWLGFLGLDTFSFDI